MKYRGIPHSISSTCMVKKMDEDTFGKKINSRSVIWNYFGLKLNENGYIRKDLEDRPVCRTCKRSISAKNGNTSNLFTHLHHSRLYTEASSLLSWERQQGTLQSSTLSTSSIQEKDPTQLTLAESINRARQYPPNSSQAHEINKTVCHYLAMGMHLISTVEEIGFRSLMYKLNPRYNCPSRKHFSEKELPQLYAHVRDTKIKPQINGVSHFSITTDFWTSALHDLYLSLTPHHIDHGWNLKSINLETTPMFPRSYRNKYLWGTYQYFRKLELTFGQVNLCHHWQRIKL